MARTVLVVILGAAGDQHLYPADPLVPPRAAEPGHAVHHFEHHSGRHVAGALRHRRHQLASRFPFEELSEPIGFHRGKLPVIVLPGGLLGMLGGFALEYWVSVLEYPLNIAGRPLASWPAFIVPAYECTILAASISAVVGMFALNGLP